MENRLVLCSAKDKFVLTQDICVMCGAIGIDQEGCLIACAQCGQCYHPYCVNVKVGTSLLMFVLSLQISCYQHFHCIGPLVVFCRPCHYSGIYSPGLHHGVTGSIPGQSVWDLHWTVMVGQVLIHVLWIFPVIIIHAMLCFDSFMSPLLNILAIHNSINL